MLKAKNISKVYRIYDRPVDRILEAMRNPGGGRAASRIERRGNV